MGKTLILGGTGTIGRHLVRQLIADPRDLEIVAAARSPRAATELQAAGLATVKLDLARPETLLPAMQDVTTLFMLKPYGIDYLIQSKIVIDAAKRAGVRHIVNLGSFGADDTVWTSIGWNRLVEAYLVVAGMAWTHLRPNFFMDNVARRIDHASGRIRHYFGASQVSWIAAEDIAAVAAAILHDPAAYRGTIVPLAAEAASMEEIATVLSEETGQAFEAEHVPAGPTLDQLVAAGWGPDFARPFVAYMDAIANGRVPEVAETHDSVEQVTGRPRIGWRDYVRRNRAAFAL